MFSFQLCFVQTFCKTHEQCVNKRWRIEHKRHKHGIQALPNPYVFPRAKSNFSLKSWYDAWSGNLIQLTQVLAIGNSGVEEKSSSPL